MMLKRGGSDRTATTLPTLAYSVRLTIGLLPFHVDPMHLEEVYRFIRRESQGGSTGQKAICQLH